MFKQTVKRMVLVAMLSSMATFAVAEEAPVFDADNFPPQFDGQPDIGNNNAPPPSYAPPTQSLTMAQRVLRAEQQINNIQSKELPGKVESLQSEVQSLRGQVEQLTRQLQQVQTQQKTMYSDLDKRLSAKQLAQAAPASTPVPDETVPQKIAPQPAGKTKADTDTVVKATPVVAKGSTAQPNVAEEQQIYQTAYDLIKAKKYNEAIVALQKMLQKYPSGQFAANARYWLGELYGLLGKNDQSAAEFAAVVKNYPESPKVSDAQLKLGLIYAAQFKWPDAKTAFKRVINHFPGTASARLAAEQLKQIKEAGH